MPLSGTKKPPRLRLRRLDILSNQNQKHVLVDQVSCPRTLAICVCVRACVPACVCIFLLPFPSPSDLAYWRYLSLFSTLIIKSLQHSHAGSKHSHSRTTTEGLGNRCLFRPCGNRETDRCETIMRCSSRGSRGSGRSRHRVASSWSEEKMRIDYTRIDVLDEFIQGEPKNLNPCWDH